MKDRVVFYVKYEYDKPTINKHIYTKDAFNKIASALETKEIPVIYQFGQVSDKIGILKSVEVGETAAICEFCVTPDMFMISGYPARMIRKEIKYNITQNGYGKLKAHRDQYNHYFEALDGDYEIIDFSVYPAFYDENYDYGRISTEEMESMEKQISDYTLDRLRKVYSKYMIQSMIKRRITMEKAKQVIAEITDNVTQHSASTKDEVAVMKAILNDPEYTVDVYSGDGKVGEYKPGADFRGMLTKIVADTTKIPKKAAAELIDNYEISKADAKTMIDVSKEFLNSYLPTGRKVSLGGRKTSDIELMWRNIEARTVEIPAKTESGRAETFIPAHGGIKVSNSCPSWLK